ncbi:hypothetical protein CHUAL_007940 [Chamberlinius hualienensis]
MVKSAELDEEIEIDRRQALIPGLDINALSGQIVNGAVTGFIQGFPIVGPISGPFIGPLSGSVAGAATTSFLPIITGISSG